jgi:hypothetical protein
MWVVVEVVADDPRVRAAVFTKARAIKLALKYDAEPGAGPMYVLPYKPVWDKRELVGRDRPVL